MSSRGGRGRRGGGGGRGRGGPKPGHCIEYKFLGTCEKLERGECHFRHKLKLENAPREHVQIPPRISTGMVVGSGGCNLKQLRRIAPQCFIKVDSEKVLFVTETHDKLKQLVEKMKLILSQKHVSGPSWRYIHPLGVSRGGSYSFRPYHGRVPVRAQSACLEMYELHRDLQQEESDDEEETVRRLAAMSPSRAEDTTEGLQSNLSRLHQPTTGDAQAIRWTLRTRIHLNPRENIFKKLDDALRVLCERRQNNSFVMRLDARFGKVTWGRLPEEMCRRKYDSESLAELLFSRDAKFTKNFNTDVKMANAEGVHSKLRHCPNHYLETFDAKVISVGGRDEDTPTRLDVRLLVRRSDDRKTNIQVLMVKKNEIKDVTFDTINLHRQHDVQIGVHHYECVQKDSPYFAVVREMMGRISFPSRHMVHIQPKTSRWNIRLIRHKRKRTYILDGNFAVTIATVSEHSFDAKKDKAVDFDMRQEGHAEMELHNLSWECAFGRDAEFPSGQALALHIERGSVDTREFDTVPHPWQPDSILRDFERFWGHLDTLSEKLDGEQ